MTITTAELFRLRNDIKEANDMADEAKNAISTHEQLCALRYEGIAKELKGIKRLAGWSLLVLASLTKSERLQELLFKVIGI